MYVHMYYSLSQHKKIVTQEVNGNGEEIKIRDSPFKCQWTECMTSNICSR